MSNKPFTIQINSLEALERLIGGSTQAEIDIRNAVVQSFTDKHLKPLAQAPDMKALAQSLSTAAKFSIEKLVAESIGEVRMSWNGLVESVKLSSPVKKEIDERVKLTTSVLIDDAVAATTKTLSEGLAARIAGAVKHRLDYEIGQEVKNQVGEAFRRALEGGTK